MQKTVHYLFTSVHRDFVPGQVESIRLIRALFRLCPLLYLIGLLIWLVYGR